MFRRLVAGGASLAVGLTGALAMYRALRSSGSSVELELNECGPRVRLDLFGMSFQAHLCHGLEGEDDGGEELEHDPEPSVEIVYVEGPDDFGELPALPRPVVPEA